jgi:hypothetical protein
MSAPRDEIVLNARNNQLAIDGFDISSYRLYIHFSWHAAFEPQVHAANQTIVLHPSQEIFLFDRFPSRDS